jgi:hypothetical protein
LRAWNRFFALIFLWLAQCDSGRVRKSASQAAKQRNHRNQMLLTFLFASTPKKS